MCTGNNTSNSQKGSLSEEQKERWKKMMECCCPDMTDEEKKKWMEEMPHMLHHLHECGGRFGMMMGKMHGRGDRFAHWNMVKEMMSSLRHNQKISTLATPEVQGLFEDWVEQIEKEILDYLKDKDPADIKGIASHFKISEESAYYFLTKLAQKGKITLNVKKGRN